MNEALRLEENPISPPINLLFGYPTILIFPEITEIFENSPEAYAANSPAKTVSLYDVP